MYELTSIAFSHYVEKARWALDRFDVPYVDHRYLPVFHFAGTYRVHFGRHGARADRVSSPYSTPVLKTPSGRVLCDSADIVRYVSDHHAPRGHGLYPSGEVASLEQHLHDALGPHTRRAAYGAMLKRPWLVRDIARRNVGRTQAALFVRSAFVTVPMLRRFLAVTPEGVRRSIERVRREMDAISRRLADGRPYLVGDRFTAADLAFACLAAPALLPREYSSWLPSAEALASEDRARVLALRETPAGQFALRMFAEERRRVVTLATPKAGAQVHA